MGISAGELLQAYPQFDALRADSGGSKWPWESCALLCAAMERCEYWRLELFGDRRCLLMKDQAMFHPNDGYYEGPPCRTDAARLVLGTTPPPPPTLSAAHVPIVPDNTRAVIGSCAASSVFSFR